MFCSIVQVISQLKVLMRSDLEAHKFDKERWSTELSPILNLWKKLNQVRSLSAFPHFEARTEFWNLTNLFRWKDIAIIKLNNCIGVWGGTSFSKPGKTSGTRQQPRRVLCYDC